MFACDGNLGSKTPVEIRRAGASAFRKRDQMQILLEQWAACQGEWRASELYFSITQRKTNRKRGCRKWLTIGEITAKYGSTETAQAIVDAKLSDPTIYAEQVRVHPDMHGVDTAESWLQRFLSCHYLRNQALQV